MTVPKLVVFDLDMCLWHPEMFQLPCAPTSWDKTNNTVAAGGETIRMFPGAIVALRELKSKSEFKDTIVAVASSTTEPGYANKCLAMFEVSDGIKASDVIAHVEIQTCNKARHFERLRAASGISYSEMLFFDDCNWGDNCADVERGCPGVVTLRTPEGLTEAKWREGLAKFAATSSHRIA